MADPEFRPQRIRRQRVVSAVVIASIVVAFCVLVVAVFHGSPRAGFPARVEMNLHRIRGQLELLKAAHSGGLPESAYPGSVNEPLDWLALDLPVAEFLDIGGDLAYWPDDYYLASLDRDTGDYLIAVSSTTEGRNWNCTLAPVGAVGGTLVNDPPDSPNEKLLKSALWSAVGVALAFVGLVALLPVRLPRKKPVGIHLATPVG